MLAISSWVMSDTDKISYFVPTARCMLAATDVGYLKVPRYLRYSSMLSRLVRTKGA